MITADLNTLELQEEWGEQTPTIRLRDAFAFYKSVGTQHSTVIYFELDPGYEVGTHRDSAEEVVLILTGTVEVTLGDEHGQLSGGQLALVPAMVPHNVRNVGTETARCVGFFADAHVVSTFEEALQPSGLQVFDTDQL